jgi:hypothetical protein
MLLKGNTTQVGSNLAHSLARQMLYCLPSEVLFLQLRWDNHSERITAMKGRIDLEQRLLQHVNANDYIRLLATDTIKLFPLNTRI